jgi:hypothetical protein
MSISKTLTNLLKRSFVEMMKDVGTSIPGHFLAFDADTQLAQIQIGVVRIDVNGKKFTPPPLIECPVAFLGGSQYFIEHQIDPGDECLIIFSQRCIDGWVNTGGVADNPILRFHDFSDAAILPGLRSQPNKINDFQNNGIRLRNKAGDKYIWLKNDDNIHIKGDIIHDGNQTTTGTINADTKITTPIVTASSSVTAAGDELANHNHGAGTYNIGGTPVTGTSGSL